MKISVLEYFLESVKLFPARIAIETDDEQWSYLDIYCKALAILEEITNLGLANSPIILNLDKSPANVAAMLATHMSGNFYVPIDTRLPTSRKEQILEQLGAGAFISKDSQMFSNKNFEFICIDERKASCGIEGIDSINVRSRTIDTDPAYIIFTSGSTGTPKGVTISHRSVIDYIEWARTEYDLTEFDSMMSQAPFYFDNSVLDLYLTISSGARLYLPNETVYVFPKSILEALKAKEITTIFWVPSVIVSVANSGLLASYDLPKLKRVLFAGEAMSVSHINAWVRALPGRVFSNLYGPTEITVDCTYFTFREEFRGDSLPIGRPCNNSDILVFSTDMTLVRAGEIGELCVRGSSLALGYWNDQEKTDAAFVQNPLNSKYQEKIYKTGDLVKYGNDGLIYYVGRKDTQIKHQGYRIELGDIESQTLRLPKINNCCVVYIPEQKLICMAISTEEDDSYASEIRTMLLDKLPKYMIPARIKFFKNMPINSNGKIDRLSVLKSFKEDL